jgi:hypothetical protein
MGNPSPWFPQPGLYQFAKGGHTALDHLLLHHYNLIKNHRKPIQYLGHSYHEAAIGHLVPKCHYSYAPEFFTPTRLVVNSHATSISSIHLAKLAPNLLCEAGNERRLFESSAVGTARLGGSDQQMLDAALRSNQRLKR